MQRWGMTPERTASMEFAKANVLECSGREDRFANLHGGRDHELHEFVSYSVLFSTQLPAYRHHELRLLIRENVPLLSSRQIFASTMPKPNTGSPTADLGDLTGMTPGVCKIHGAFTRAESLVMTRIISNSCCGCVLAWSRPAGKWKTITKTLNDFYYDPGGRGEWDKVDAKAQGKAPLVLVIVGVALLLSL